MSQEEYDPTEEEVNAAIGSAEEQMKGHYPESTEDNINNAMQNVAAQLGEKFEVGDPAVSEGDIVEKYRKEGWSLADVITNAAKVSIGEKEGKEIKIVGLGDKFLVFEKEEQD